MFLFSIRISLGVTDMLSQLKHTYLSIYLSISFPINLYMPPIFPYLPLFLWFSCFSFRSGEQVIGCSMLFHVMVGVLSVFSIFELTAKDAWNR